MYFTRTLKLKVIRSDRGKHFFTTTVRYYTAVLHDVYSIDILLLCVQYTASCCYTRKSIYRYHTGSQVVVLRSFLTTMGKERVASQFFLAQCGGPIFVLRKIPIDPIVRDISLDVPMLVQQFSEQ